MQIEFPYGESTLTFTLDDELKVDVVRAKPEKPLARPKQRISESLRNPKFSKPLPEILSEKGDGKVCIVISDSTRPVPSKIIVEPILALCEENRIPDDQIQIL